MQNSIFTYLEVLFWEIATCPVRVPIGSSVFQSGVAKRGFAFAFRFVELCLYTLGVSFSHADNALFHSFDFWAIVTMRPISSTQDQVMWIRAERTESTSRARYKRRASLFVDETVEMVFLCIESSLT